MITIRRLTTTVAAGAATLSLLTAVTLSGAAGATTAPDSPADDTVAPGAAVTMIDAGDPDDAVLLSLDWRNSAPTGTVLRNSERTEFGGSVAVAGQTIDVLAESTLVDIREIVGVDDAGTTTVRVVVDSFSEDAADAMSARLAAPELRATLVGIPVLVSFDADGERLGAEFEELADPTADQHRALDDVLVVTPMELPATPVGTGARWTAPYAGLGDSALLAEFELIEVTDSSFTITFEVADIAAAFIDDVEMDDTVPGADSTITGTLTASLEGRPVHYDMAVSARLVFTTEDPAAGLTYEFDLTTTRSATLTTV